MTTFHYQRLSIDKKHLLGRGSYGAVYKAKCDQLPCAAKILHPTILDGQDTRAGRNQHRFEQECSFLSKIQHPHIVQFLCMSMDRESNLPVLVMELLDESLTKMLERSQQPLAYHIQVDLCHDISLAVAYLHSNDIIHRDLSSNNVLIIAGKRAKVTDFGMSKLADASPSMTPLTTCPGTAAYMPPEAMKEPPKYTKKLDCFSEGVIMIQLYTQKWPVPGPRTESVPDPRSPTGTAEVPVLEIERRKNDISKINETHPLLPLIHKCLSNNAEERPSSEELCQKLAELQEREDYKKSAQPIKIIDNNLERQIREMREAMIQKNEIIGAKDKEIEQLKIQLQEQERITAEIQRAHNDIGRQRTESRSLSISSGPSSLPRIMGETDEPLQWREENGAPKVICRGAIAVDTGCNGNTAYFMDDLGEVYPFDMITQSWNKPIKKCPHQDCGLVILDRKLIAVGGRILQNKVLAKFRRSDHSTLVNELLTYEKNWKRIFTPMPTERYGVTALTTGHHLIVAGGKIGQNTVTRVVEIMDIESKLWSGASSLPNGCSRAFATIAHDKQLYLSGGEGEQAVYTCSVAKLVQSDPKTNIWRTITDPPVYRSTCVYVNGELLAVGGYDDDSVPTGAVYKYNTQKNNWDFISWMPTARFNCLIVVLPTLELMVVGGESGLSHQKTNIVEVASFN